MRCDLAFAILTFFFSLTLCTIELRAQLSLPLDHLVITSAFGLRTHPVTKRLNFHGGIDLKAHYESVYAILDGRVLSTGSDSILGKYIKIAHGKLQSVYGHLSQIWVEKGAFVNSGAKIGWSGNTGRTSGPHLHFSLLLNQKKLNPALILNQLPNAKLKNMKEKQLIQDDQLGLPALLLLLTDYNQLLLSPAQAREYGIEFADELPVMEEEENGN